MLLPKVRTQLRHVGTRGGVGRMGEGRAGALRLEGGGLGTTPAQGPCFWKASILTVFALSPNPLTCPRHFGDLAPALRLPLPPGQQSSKAHRVWKAFLTA